MEFAVHHQVFVAGQERIVAGTNLAGWDQSPDPSHGDATLALTFDTNARRLLRLGRGAAGIEAADTKDD